MAIFHREALQMLQFIKSDESLVEKFHDVELSGSSNKEVTLEELGHQWSLFSLNTI
jgi:uncharacterized protein YpiB (UPF0302 family)